MNRFTDFLDTIRHRNSPKLAPNINKKAPENQEAPSDGSIRLQSRPVIETPAELDGELYASHWPELYEKYLDHLIEDIKGGNLNKEQEYEVNFYLNCATMCKTWHKNPKHILVRSSALWVGQVGAITGVSMSRDAKMFDGFRTGYEKKHEKREMKPQKGLLPGLGGNKEEKEW